MEQLTTEMIMVMVMICVAIFLFIVEWIRVDVVAILMMVALPLLNLVTPKEAFIGFSSNAVISIIAVIIIGAGLDKTGVINRLVTPVLKIAGKSSSRIMIAISLTVAGISSFMQNIGAAALFLPAIQRISKKLKIPLSQLLMPIGFSAILGGTITLVGSSPLILLNDLLAPFNLEEFGLFDVTPIGLALVCSGIIYFIFFGHFVLPHRTAESDEASATEGVAALLDTYEDIGNLFEVRTPENFTHYREPITINDLKKKYLVNVAAIFEPPNFTTMSPSLDTEIKDRVVLAVYGTEDNIQRMAEAEAIQVKEGLDVFKNILSASISGAVEAVVAPRSNLIGKTLQDVNLAEQFRVTPLAVYHHGRTLKVDVSNVILDVGDAVLLHGTYKALTLLQRQRNLILTTPVDVEQMKPEKAAFAALWLGIALVMVIVFKIQLSVCLMTGALGMIITKVLSIDEAYQSVDWRTIFLLAGLIPLGIATEKTGTAAWIAHSVLGLLGPVSPIFLLTVIGVLSTVFTLVISNVGATVLLVPLVVNMALAANTDPRMAALVVGLATSNSFLLPTHQVNALYMGPGHYRSVDFMKAGSILSIIFIVVMIATIYLFYL
ncbi:SLC13 family permease [candidate division CSSED10-310 bacterium]|uniref:SLC13 family permease n=1 Tax=candidate division CSSED10-310 bacterium TaxID=2855610 RepID=A0ABV6YW85_UNCC1